MRGMCHLIPCLPVGTKPLCQAAGGHWPSS